MPHHEAGMRTLPPPSEPVQKGTCPPATAAEEPPLEPRDAEEQVLTDGGVTELRRVRLADRDSARLLQPLDLRRVAFRVVVSEGD
jgi:hypothetical protein